MKENQELIRQEPLNPRDGFYAGRTNAIKLYHKVSVDEKVMYLDVCNLYLFVNNYSIYPVGYPEIIVGNAKCRAVWDNGEAY